MGKYIPPAACPFNGAVLCDKQDKCDRCGWNPKVKEERLEKIREERQEEQKRKCEKPIQIRRE